MDEFDIASLDRFQEIQGDLLPEDGREIFNLALKGPGSNQHIVEVGSFRGRTTAYLAKACSIEGRGVVVSIDDYSRYDKEVVFKKEVDVGEILNKNLYKHRVSPWCLQFDGSPEGVAARWNNPIRILCITGPKTFHEIKSAFDAWINFLIPEGTVVFTNYDLSETQKFVESIWPQYYVSNLLSNVVFVQGIG